MSAITIKKQCSLTSISGNVFNSCNALFHIFAGLSVRMNKSQRSWIGKLFLRYKQFHRQWKAAQALSTLAARFEVEGQRNIDSARDHSLGLNEVLYEFCKLTDCDFKELRSCVLCYMTTGLDNATVSTSWVIRDNKGYEISMIPKVESAELTQQQQLLVDQLNYELGEKIRAVVNPQAQRRAYVLSGGLLCRENLRAELYRLLTVQNGGTPSTVFIHGKQKDWSRNVLLSGLTKGMRLVGAELPLERLSREMTRVSVKPKSDYLPLKDLQMKEIYCAIMLTVPMYDDRADDTSEASEEEKVDDDSRSGDALPRHLAVWGSIPGMQDANYWKNLRSKNENLQRSLVKDDSRPQVVCQYTLHMNFRDTMRLKGGTFDEWMICTKLLDPRRKTKGKIDCRYSPSLVMWDRDKAASVSLVLFQYGGKSND